MSLSDDRTENQRAFEERRFGTCDLCDDVLLFDSATHEIYCPAGPDVHPERIVRRPLPSASPVAIERAKIDAERIEEIWKLEEDADDPARERELRVEEKAVMADFDRALPPSADSPAIGVAEHAPANDQQG